MVRRDSGAAGLPLLMQAGHADSEELVEVLGEDRQESRPFEDRIALVARLPQDPRVEFEPGQLAIQERLLVGRGRRRLIQGKRRVRAIGSETLGVVGEFSVVRRRLPRFRDSLPRPLPRAVCRGAGSRRSARRC
jgi:hypothetical protein